MKLILKTCKPRNPFAMAARSRAAGAHRPSARTGRQVLETSQRAGYD